MANSKKDEIWKIHKKVIAQRKYETMVENLELFLNNTKFSFSKKEQDVLENAQKLIEQKVNNLKIELLNNGENFDTSKIIK